MKPSRLWLVTGERGAGKTNFCRAVAERARRAGWQVGGLLSPAVFDGGTKTGITMACLPAGGSGSYPLASRRNQPPFTRVLGEWYFDPQVLEWGNIVLDGLQNTQGEKKILDLLVVDEIGPLEILRKEGWTAALPLLNGYHYRVGLVVIRPELVETALPVLPPLQGMITLDPAQNPETEAEDWWGKVQHD
jgi:nucleoside-triphosphatase